MSNRRKPRQQRQAERQARASNQPHPTDDHPLDEMMPWIWAMQDADEAERRGDATTALTVIDRRALDPEGKPFWRPARVCGLRQLAELAPHLPAWVWSRWILAQALQHLDEVDRGVRAERASQVAIDLHDGLASLSGRDDVDKRAGVADFDWLYRQVHLYELGGLEAFLRTAATPDLVAGADRIDEWAVAPMGGYLYLGPGEDRLLWHDHGAGDVVETLNIGSGARLLGGAHVIGRVVPVEGGAVFEGPPLEVPRAVAREVATRPSAWLDVLRGVAPLLRDDTIVTQHREWRALCSDVPIDSTTRLLAHRAVGLALDLESVEAMLASAALDLASCELEREARLETTWGDEEFPEDDEWDGWAYVHAALVVPEVVTGLSEVVRPEDARLLAEIHDRVAEPARSIVGSMLARVQAAA